MLPIAATAACVGYDRSRKDTSGLGRRDGRTSSYPLPKLVLSFGHRAVRQDVAVSGRRKRLVPASGYRNNSSGGVNNVGSNGNYWSSSPNSTDNGRNLNFNSTNLNPLNNNNRANGFSVLPARIRPCHKAKAALTPALLSFLVIEI